MTSPWQEYKKKLGDTRPWDVLNPHTEKATEDQATSRLAICKECPSLIKATHQCKECGCLMKLKVKLAHAACPLSKW